MIYIETKAHRFPKTLKLLASRGHCQIPHITIVHMVLGAFNSSFWQAPQKWHGQGGKWVQPPLPLKFCILHVYIHTHAPKYMHKHTYGWKKKKKTFWLWYCSTDTIYFYTFVSQSNNPQLHHHYMLAILTGLLTIKQSQWIKSVIQALTKQELFLPSFNNSYWLVHVTTNISCNIREDKA